MHVISGNTHPPLAFTQAVAEVGRVRLRPEIQLEEVPAPRDLAPDAATYVIRVLTPFADQPLATGRFVVLHDPQEQEAWGGAWRVVIFAQAELDDEVGADPLLGEVGWSWLADSLAERGVVAAHLGGTVSRLHSEGFGHLAGKTTRATLEIRASWSPTDHHVGRHLQALGDLLTRMAGLPPPPEHR